MYLDDTIRSVLSQTYPNIEYIIVDGLSTDNTPGIIERYRSSIDIVISEADSGMYDAINKGLKAASGDYILILNSDDVLAGSDIIAKVAAAIISTKSDYYYGNIIKSANGKIKHVKLFNVNYRELLWSTHGTFVPHPCFFISAGLNRKLGGYDNSYRYAADYDYILRALNEQGVKGQYLNEYITRFRIHENSITASGKIDQERKNILINHHYYKYPSLTRLYNYYRLWIYYKIINLGHSYKAG